MPLLYNGASALWSTAASSFPAAEKYCHDNNISWTTTGNVAAELASICVWGPLAVLHQTGTAAITTVAGGFTSAIAAWAFSAKDLVAQAAHSTIAAPHAWYFGGAPAKSVPGAAMVKELSLAAGAQALHLGCYAVKGAYTVLSLKTTEFIDDVTVVLDSLEDKLFGGDIFLAADAAVVTTPAFSWDDEDSDWLLAKGLQHSLGTDGAGQHAWVPPGQDRAAATGDFAMEHAPWAGQQPDLVGICPDAPLC